MIRFLSSLKLTLALFFSLALIAIIGTLQPMAEGRYDLFYQSPWFRLLLALLALNLSVCTLKTIRRNLGDRARFFATLQSEQVFAGGLRQVLPGDAAVEPLAAALGRRGYRVQRQGEALLARRGVAGRWGSTLVHLSVLFIMVGALSAAMGFVGTVNLLVGDKSAVYFDWNRQQELPLGFEFRLDHFEPSYYPIELQFVAIDPASRKLLQTYTVREGDTVSLPTPGMRAKVIRYFFYEEDLALQIFYNDLYLGEYHALGGKQQLRNSVDPGVELRPLAYRDPVIRQLQSEVSILERGQVVQKALIEVNHPLVYRGIAIYQTAYNRDKFGFWSAGFQLSRDPGEPVVWFGCITLLLGLLGAFAVPYRVVGINRVGGEVLLVALAGFSGEAGTDTFARLAAGLNQGDLPA